MSLALPSYGLAYSRLNRQLRATPLALQWDQALDAAAHVMHPKQQALVTGEQVGSREITTFWVSMCTHRSTYIRINWDPYFFSEVLSEFSSFLCFLNFYFALLQAALFKLLTCVGVNSVEFKQQQRLSGRQHTLYFHVICPFPSQCSRESGCRKSILGLYLVYKLWKQMLK